MNNCANSAPEIIKIAPMMIKQGGGSIINFASCHTLKISPEHEVYMSTKAAIEAMTKSFGVQLAPYGVRVNAIRPGWCLTENHFTSEPKGTDFKKAAASLPLRYISTPYDIGDLVVALVTELHYFAGAILDYTGGHGLIAPGVDDITAPLKGRFGRAYVKGLK